jgi:anti-anti-sigma factor
MPATMREYRMGPGRHRMPPQIELTPTTIDDTAVGLAVDGELDMATVGQFDRTVQAILAQSGLTRLVLDFALLEFISSGGVYALVAAHQTARRRNVTLTIVNCPDPLRQVLQTTGLLDDLTTRGTDRR